MTQRTLGDQVREYLQLDFAGDDKIFLPADQAGASPATRVLRPRGCRSLAAESGRIRSAGFGRRSSISLMTCSELYAAREQAAGFAHPDDTTWQRELEESSATEHHERSTNARPMWRATWPVAGPWTASSPGTWVARPRSPAGRVPWWSDDRSRSSSPPSLPSSTCSRSSVVSPLSRSGSKSSADLGKADQQRIIGELAAGTVDVVVGTHRLLSRDVSFADPDCWSWTKSSASASPRRRRSSSCAARWTFRPCRPRPSRARST